MPELLEPPYDLPDLRPFRTIQNRMRLQGGAVVTENGTLRSDDYVAGVSGWSIDGDGDAEFNDVTARGDIIADRLLTEATLLQDWDFEVDADGWTDGNGSSTVARSTTSPISGTGSLLITAAGSTAAKSPQFAVEAGRFYAVTLAGDEYDESGSVTRDEQFTFYTSGGTPLSSTWSTTGIDRTYAEGETVGSAIRRIAYAQAPATAALAEIQVESTAASDKIDDVQVWEVGSVIGAVLETTPVDGAAGVRVASDLKFLNHNLLPDQHPRLGPLFVYSALGAPWGGQGLQLDSGKPSGKGAAKVQVLSDSVEEVIAALANSIFLKASNLYVGSSNDDIARNILGAWEAYTPTNTGISLGNGVRNSAFMLIGKTCFFRWSLIWGSTTAFTPAGTEIELGLPFAAVARYQAVSGFAVDTGTRNYPIIGRIDPSATVLKPVHAETAGSLTSRIDDNSPFSWTDGDILAVTGMYEIA